MADIRFGTDREILQTAADWAGLGLATALVTVVRTWGSSPRPPGSLLVMREDGRFEGSVSGGCIEDDLVARFRNGELAKLPTVIDYGVKTEEAARFGLPCGGRLELLVERLDEAASLRALLQRLDDGRLVRRHICLGTGEVSLHDAQAGEDFSADVYSVSQVFGPSWQLLLIGAGQLARYTARIALLLGYKVIVCDPREEHRLGWHEPGVELIASMPDDAVRTLADHPCAVVVTLAHDPKVDDMALMEALKSKAFYVGALGSKNTSVARNRRLAQLDLTPEQLKRLYAPVGLDIGSRTPPEIALSIMAGITAERRAVSV